MKLPTIFKTASHQRFAIKPRYYDPIKEEIEERTSRIRRELEEEGLLEGTGAYPDSKRSTSMRGSFSSYRGMKPRDNATFSAATLIRTFLFLAMVTAAFGYIYIGPDIFTYLGVVILAVFGIYYFFRLKKKRKNA
jgi:Flp pilus assembly protein TadB